MTTDITAFRVESYGWNAARAHVTVASPGTVFIRSRPKSDTAFGNDLFSEATDGNNQATITAHGYTRDVRYVVQASRDQSFSDPAQLEFTHDWKNFIRDIEATEVTYTTALVKLTVVPNNEDQVFFVRIGFPTAPHDWQLRRLPVPADTSSVTTLYEGLAIGTTYIIEAYDNTPFHRTLFGRLPKESFTPPPITLVFSQETLNIVEGDSGQYTVALEYQPKRNLTIDISADGDVTTEPTSLLFTATNWNTPQAVAVTVNSDADDKDDTSTISHTVTVTEGAESIALGDVRVIIRDDDSVTLVVSKETLNINEGESDDYTVALKYQPKRDLAIDISADGDLTTEPTSLLFTATNWNTPQAVTVTANHDEDEAGDTSTVSHTVAGTEGAGLTALDGVRVNIRDDDYQTGIPTAPQHLRVETTDSGIANLSWTRPANALQQRVGRYLALRYSVLRAYRIEICRTGCNNADDWHVLVENKGVQKREYVHQVLPPGVIRENRYRVRGAININDEHGPWSNVATLAPTMIENYRVVSPDSGTLRAWFDLKNPDGRLIYVRYQDLAAGGDTNMGEPIRPLTKDRYRFEITENVQAHTQYRVDLDWVNTFDSPRKKSYWAGTPRVGHYPLQSPYAVDALDAQVFAGGVWRDASDTALYVRMGGTGKYRVRLKPCQGIHDVIVHRIQAPAGRLRASPMETDPVLFTNLNCESEFDDWRRDEHGEPLTMDQVYDMTNFPDRAKDFIPIYAGTPNNWHEVTVTARALEDYPADRRYDALLSAPFAVVYNHSVWKEVTTSSSYLVSDGTGLVRVLVDRPTDAVLPVPGGVTIGSDRVMTWDAVSGATGYLVEWRHGPQYSDRANQNRSLQTATSVTLPPGASGSRSGYGAGARLQQQRRERVVARADVGQPPSDAEHIRRLDPRGKRLRSLPGNLDPCRFTNGNRGLHYHRRDRHRARRLHRHQRHHNLRPRRDPQAHGLRPDCGRRPRRQRRDLRNGPQQPDRKRCQQRRRRPGRRQRIRKHTQPRRRN